MNKQQADFINDLSREVYEANKLKGFWDTNRSDLECLALIFSEVAEAVEMTRIGNPLCDVPALQEKLAAGEEYATAYTETCKETFDTELADIIIRVLDLAGRHGVDIGTVIALKLKYNKTRPHKHSKQA